MKTLVQKWDVFMTPERTALSRDIGLLILRLGVGSMMAFSHGLGKIQNLVAGGEVQFRDPIGIGVWPSLLLAGSTEFFAALAVMAGFFTRVATMPLIFTMAVVVLIVHVQDPFAKQEFGLLYLFAFVTLLFAGPGRFSVDAKLREKLVR